MRKYQIVIALLLASTGCSAFVPLSVAQSAPAFKLGGNYTFVRTNAGPGDCGCVNMHGGGGWASYNFTRSVGIVGEVAAQRASDIPHSTRI